MAHAPLAFLATGAAALNLRLLRHPMSGALADRYRCPLWRVTCHSVAVPTCGRNGREHSGLPAMIAVPLLAPMLKRYSACDRVVFGFCVSAMGAAGAVLVSQSVVQLALVLLVFVAAAVMTAPALVELISANAEPGDRGVAMELYGFFMFLGGSVGSQLVGQFGHTSFEVLLLAITAAFIAGAGMTIFTRVSATRR